MSYIGQRPVVGRYIKLDQISSGFNGSETSFSMTAGSQAVFPGTARNLLLSLGGVIQEPDTDFTISGSTLTFTTPPVSNTTFFGVIYGDMQAIGTPSDGTVLPISIASSGNFTFPEITLTGDLTIPDKLIHSGDTDTNIRFPSNNTISAQTAGSEAIRITNGQKVLIGSTSLRNVGGSSTESVFQIEGISQNRSSISLINNQASASPASLRLGKTRGTSVGAVDAVTDGDQLGQIRFVGSDGTDLENTTAMIIGRVNGTVSSNTIPTDIAFETSATNGNSRAERMRIDSAGDIGIGTDNPLSKLHVRGSGTTNLRVDNSDDGTASLTLGNTGSSNLVIAQTSANATFSIGGSEHLRIAGSGNVGIGTSSPTSKLNVAGRLDVDGLQNQNTAEIFANSTSGQSFGLLVNGGSTSGDYCANFRDKDAGAIMILRGDGKVGIGTSTPSVKLTVTSSNASGGDIVSFQNSVVNHYGGLVIKGGQNDRECRFNAAFGNGYMTFYPMPNSGAGSEHMRIRHGGVCMGRTTLTSFTAALHVSATAGGGIAIATHADTTCMFFNRTDNNAAYVAMRFYVQGSQKGFIQVNTGSVTYSTSSDYRLKENVVSISDGITRLKKLKPYRFNFKEDTSKTLDGFFAHEASEVVPEAVVGEKDAIKDGKIDPQGIDQSKIVPLLTAALQEAITKIETLETKVAALEAA